MNKTDPDFLKNLLANLPKELPDDPNEPIALVVEGNSGVDFSNPSSVFANAMSVEAYKKKKKKMEEEAKLRHMPRM